MSINNVQVIRFYTEKSEPLNTMEPIPFILEYRNTGSTTVSPVPARILLGSRIKSVNLPGIAPGKTNRITIQLTNNINENLEQIGVRISDKDILAGAIKHYRWKGIIDARVGSVSRDSSQPLFWIDGQVQGTYKVQIANYGTKDVTGAKVRIQANHVGIGSATVNIPARRIITVSFPVQSSNGGRSPLRFTVFHENKVIATGDTSIGINSYNNNMKVVSLECEKSSFEMNEPAQLKVRVRNNGELPIANLTAEFKDLTIGSILGSTTFKGLIEVGSEVERKIQINNEANRDEMTLQVTLDPKRTLSDTNLSDNKKNTTIRWGNASQFISQNEVNNFLQTYNLSSSSKAAQALNLINSKYASKSPVQQYASGTIVYVAEGAGNYQDRNILGHPDGRFGAATFVIRNGKVVHFTPHASTLADDPMNLHRNEGYKASILPGIYYGKSYLHLGKYPCLRLNDNKEDLELSNDSSIPSLYYDVWTSNGGTKNALGIHLHAASINSKTHASSEGCITICKNLPKHISGDTAHYYNEFGMAAGFMTSEKQTASYTSYNKIKQQNALVIIDRSLMDDSKLDNIFIGANSEFKSLVRG